MIEQFLRLIPHWVVPALLAAAAWLFLIHTHVSETVFARMALPNIKETKRQATAYAAYQGISMPETAVDAYLRCLYGTVFATEGFHFGFSVYLASGTLIGSDALNDFQSRLNAAIASDACGKAPWLAK